LPRLARGAHGARGYESFYLRAVDPDRPRSVWLRHTTLAGFGSTWLTLFDADAPAPVTAKRSHPGPAKPPGSWIRIGDSHFRADGVTGPEWDVGWSATEPPLRHLPREWMYRAPLPRTKLESPAPDAVFSGTVHGVRLDGWRGMVGHNWGSEHAERWIWLHGTLFEGAPDAWLDIALGRIAVAGRTTPWIANGVVSIGGRRTRVGGLRSATVHEDPLHLRLELPELRLTARSPREQTVVWRYGDRHHTANCSIASLDVEVGGRRLRTRHGGAYELGMREAPAGLPVQPHADP
jgi:hypothetical protein